MKNNSEQSLEKSVVGSLLLDPATLQVYFPLLKKEMFTMPISWTFLSSAYTLLLSDKFTKANLYHEVEKKNIKDVGEKYTDFISNVTGRSDSEKNYSKWVGIGRTNYFNTIEPTLAEKHNTPDELLSAKIELALAAKVLGMPNVGTSYDDAINNAVSRMERIWTTKGANFLSTTIPSLDHYLIGFAPGTCNVIQARPSIGKTSLGCQIALAAEKTGKRVLFNSLEMPPESLVLRFSGIETKMNTARFSAPHKCSETDYRNGVSAIKSTKGKNINITCISDPKVLDSTVRFWKPDVIIHDFLQYPSTPSHYRGNRPEFLGDTARFFAESARDFGLISVVLSQIGRLKESSDLGAGKGSSGIEEAADCMINLDAPGRDQGGIERLRRHIHIVKARYGFAGVAIDALFNEGCQIFEDWDTNRAAKIASALGYI